MKTVKTILALALAMIAFLPACKKVDYTKNSSNILISQYRVAEELIGMDATNVISTLKSAGWENNGSGLFTKYSGDCYLTIEAIGVNTKEQVTAVSFSVAPAEPESEKEVFSDKDYSNFLTMMGKTPTVGKNSVQCNFSYAYYYNETGEEDVDYESYDEYNKNLDNLVKAYRSGVEWVGTAETSVMVDRQKSGSEAGFFGVIYVAI